MSQQNHWYDFILSVGKNVTLIVNLVVLLLILVWCMVYCYAVAGRSSCSSLREVVHQDYILVLRLEGLIIDSSEFLTDLHRYMGKKKIKGV